MNVIEKAFRHKDLKGMLSVKGMLFTDQELENIANHQGVFLLNGGIYDPQAGLG